jgi:hypothetical protein
VIIRSANIEAALHQRRLHSPEYRAEMAAVYRQRAFKSLERQRGFILNPFRFGSGPPPTDPDFASVVLLLHMDGTNGSSTIIDSSNSAHTMTAQNGAVLTTGTKKFGTAALDLDGASKHVTAPHSTDFSIQASDFTLECWVYRRNSSNSHYLLSKRSASLTDGWEWRISGLNNVQYFHTGVAVATSTGTVANSQWVFLMTNRSGTTVSHFIDGAASGSATVGNGTENTDTTLKVGISNSASDCLDGFLDDIRMTKTVARANAVPSAAFPDS